MQPPYLKEGATIGITCPAGYVSAERIAYAVQVLTKWGYAVRIGKTVGTEHFYFSGKDEARLADLQSMLDDPTIDAILMGRGGYGTSRILDRIDFTGFLQHPKWICGFSDITALHSHLLAAHNCASLHSPMCGAFTAETEDSAHIQSLLLALSGKPMTYHTTPSVYNREGKAKAVITGGNLALLAHVTGSVSEVDMSGKILFVEDIGEHLYGIDRMMLHLKRAGKLKDLAGLVVGSFTDMQDTERPFGETLEQIIDDKVREYAYPVCYNFPAGHQEVNFTLTLGAVHTLEVTHEGGVISVVR